MTNPTPHGQVPEALIDLIDAYAETRHRCGGIYNARTEAARKAVIEALSGVQALSAAPGVTSEQRRLIGVIADKIEDGTLFQSGIYPKKDLARFVRNMLDVTPTAPAASPTPPSLSPACGYFSFSDECGFDRHDTVEAAKAAATEMLADIRSELCGEEWPMAVESICWGVVVERAAEHETTTGEDGEKYCDYTLKGGVLEAVDGRVGEGVAA